MVAQFIPLCSPPLSLFLRSLKLLLLVCCLGLLGNLLAALPAQAQSRILFVGTSFTHGYEPPVINYNVGAVTDENAGLPVGHPRYESEVAGPWGGVPAIFKKFTDQAGLPYEVHIEALNGGSLEAHYDNALPVIQQAQWDQVVLQENSSRPLPTNRGGDPATFANYANLLEQAIHSANPAAQVYLYETWARADLTYMPGQPYSGQPIDSMAADLHEAYDRVFNQNGNFEAVAPVGDAWLRAIQTGVAMRNPYLPAPGHMDLWTSYFHASRWGSYLSACVLFYKITGVDPRTLGGGEQAAAALGITPVDAIDLQQIAYGQVSGAPVPVTYELTINTVGGGSVSKSLSRASYTPGSSVSLRATPAAGYQFSGWSGDAAGMANPISVNMDDDQTITANFSWIGPQLVTSFTLIDADTDQDIQTLSPGSILNLATLPTMNLNVRANTGPAIVGSVVFDLTGAQSLSQVETLEPYALFSNDSGDYYPWSPDIVAGSYTLTAAPYTGGGGTGTMGVPLSVSFSVVDQPVPGSFTLAVTSTNGGSVGKSPNRTSYAPGSLVTLTATPATGYQFGGWSGDASGTANPLTVTMSSSKSITATFIFVGGQQVTSFTLIDADTDQDLQTLTNGATLNLATLPANLNVRANTNPATVGSVVFDLGGTQLRDQTETLAPYALFSDAGGDYNPWSPALEVGGYTLEATPFTGGGGSGTVGIPLSISFSVIDQPVPAQYTLTVNATGSGSVSKSPAQASYVSGSSVVLTATPAAGYQFDGWSGDASGSSNPLTVGMTTNKTITATFSAIPEYALLLSTTGSGTVSKSPNQATYLSGSSVVLTATPAAGYKFNGWSGAATGTTNPLTVAMTSTKSIEAAFTLIAPQYTLTVNTTGSGTVSKSPNLAMYNSGSNVVLTATPAAGYKFNGWSGAATGTANPITVAMTASKTITATFTALTQYRLSLYTLGSGTVSRSPSLAMYNSGSNVVLTATPAAGYRFVGWIGSAIGTTNPLTLTMNGNRAILATFAPIPQYTLTVNTSGSGSVSKSPNQSSYASGSNVTLTATPASGYRFSGWSGNASGTANPLTVSMSSSKKITATFVVVPQYRLTVTTFGSGTVGRSPNLSMYNSGSNVVLTATPAAGYRFSGWSGNAAGSTNPLAVSMTANKTIMASFSQIQQVSSFTLMNADNDQSMQTLSNGTTLNLASLATRNLNIRANTNLATVGSVRFSLTGAAGRSYTDSSTPFALFGGTGSNYSAWTPAVGSYTLVATPYSGANGEGLAGTPLSISFNVVNTALSHALTVTTSGSGSVSRSPNQSSYSSGSTVTLTATAASGYQFSGWSGAATGSTNPLAVLMNGSKAMTATFTAITATQQVSSFTLLNANTNQSIMTLSNGATLNLASLPTRNLNIRANTSPATVGSVAFSLSGTQTMALTQSQPPYALLPTSGGYYNPWDAASAVGSYTLRATPYTGSNGSGKAGTPLMISFNVINGAARDVAADGTTVAAAGTEAAPATPARPAAALRLSAYPNPSPNGRFQVQLSEPLQGRVAYTLVSALGARISSGELNLSSASTQLELDFSRVMTSQGLYYLLLESTTQAARPLQLTPLKLLRH
jgi:uncharacterized repeat protein (TIGR02543 family)